VTDRQTDDATETERVRFRLTTLTVCVLERLFLLAWFRDDFDASTRERAQVSSVAVQTADGQREVLALVRVRYVQRLRRTIVLKVKR